PAPPPPVAPFHLPASPALALLRRAATEESHRPPLPTAKESHRPGAPARHGRSRRGCRRGYRVDDAPSRPRSQPPLVLTPSSRPEQHCTDGRPKELFFFFNLGRGVQFRSILGIGGLNMGGINLD
ncbi:unnamed protein product, partial [Urochloa humidicola]